MYVYYAYLIHSIYNVDQEQEERKKWVLAALLWCMYIYIKIRPQFWLAGPQQNDRSSGQQCGHSAAFLIIRQPHYFRITSCTFVSNKNKKQKEKETGCRRDQLCAWRILLYIVHVILYVHMNVCTVESYRVYVLLRTSVSVACCEARNLDIFLRSSHLYNDDR